MRERHVLVRARYEAELRSAALEKNAKTFSQAFLVARFVRVLRSRRLWEAIAGRRLVEAGTNEVAALQGRLTGVIPPLRELAPDAPEDLVAIAEKALRSDPDERYATAEEMQNAIEEHLRASSNPQGRDLGKLVRDAFAAERTKLKKTIEEQLATPSASVPEMPSAIGASSFSPVASSTKDAPRAAESVDVTLSALTPAPRASRTRTVGIVVLTLAALGGLALARSSRSKDAEAIAAPTPTQAESKPTPAPPAESAPTARPIRIELAIEPRDAKATLDGVAIAASEPLVRPLDEHARHVLAVSAPGRKPFTREIVFDRDQSLAIDLAPVSGNVAARPAAKAATAQPSPTPALAPPKTDDGFGEVQKRKPRPIDTSSPF